VYIYPCVYIEKVKITNLEHMESFVGVPDVTLLLHLQGTLSYHPRVITTVSEATLQSHILNVSIRTACLQSKADPEIFQSLGEPKCDIFFACTSMKMNISYEKNTFNKSFDGHGTLRTH
jgi:hypothetical protein